MAELVSRRSFIGGVTASGLLLVFDTFTAVKRRRDGLFGGGANRSAA